MLVSSFDTGDCNNGVSFCRVSLDSVLQNHLLQAVVVDHEPPIEDEIECSQIYASAAHLLFDVFDVLRAIRTQ